MVSLWVGVVGSALTYSKAGVGGVFLLQAILRPFILRDEDVSSGV